MLYLVKQVLQGPCAHIALTASPDTPVRPTEENEKIGILLTPSKKSPDSYSPQHSLHSLDGVSRCYSHVARSVCRKPLSCYCFQHGSQHLGPSSHVPLPTPRCCRVLDLDLK